MAWENSVLGKLGPMSLETQHSTEPWESRCLSVIFCDSNVSAYIRHFEGGEPSSIKLGWPVRTSHLLGSSLSMCQAQ